jgi:hypothetical protein
MSEKNPFLEPENYYEGYQQSIETLRNKPEAIELDKLCYYVFSTEDGKKFLQEVTERFLIPGFIHPQAPNMEQAAIYYEGFKEAFRMIRNCIRSHEQRIQAESTRVSEIKKP